MAFSDGIADFRSDTVTRPTEDMRRAMATAEVGDDAYGEDPTVNRLEEEVAAVLGKEAAVFVPTGTMGNQLAINCQTAPGDEVLCVAWAHIRNYERGAAGALSGVQLRTVPAEDGVITPDQVREAVSEGGGRLPRLGLLAWENTHNASGGTVVPLGVMRESSLPAREAGVPVHLDGARIWNAEAATGTPVAELAAVADTVMSCFSKGLGAPVGSVLCGVEGVIAEARYRRKRFGGGMRQAGVLAAAALVALRDRARVTEDHDTARYLAEGLAARHPKAVDPDRVQTNMVMVDEGGLPFSVTDLQARLREGGVLVGLMRPRVLRFVTHRDVDRRDVVRVLGVVEEMSG